MKRFVIAPIIIFTLIFTTNSSSFAQVLEGDGYILRLGEDAQEKTTGNLIRQGSYTPEALQKNKIIYGKGFKAILSYENDLKNLPLVITVSSDAINFGEIKPGEPITRTLSLKMIPGSAKGFQVLVIEDGNLKSEGKQIPPTSCDSGNCNQILPDLWTLPLVYGLGYNSSDMPVNYYKRFSNMDLDEQPVSIFHGSEVNQSSTLTYKLNIAGNQPEMGYQNIIEYIISPNL